MLRTEEDFARVIKAAGWFQVRGKWFHPNAWNYYGWYDSPRSYETALECFEVEFAMVKLVGNLTDKSPARFLRLALSVAGALLVCSCLCLGYAISAELPKSSQQQKLTVKPVVRASRFSWPGLGQDKTIALGEALKGSRFKVTIWCATIDCNDLAAGFDDAFQIADIASDIDRREVDNSSEVGIFVGPTSVDAINLADVISKTTGITVKIVEAPKDAPLMLIIGKKPR